MLGAPGCGKGTQAKKLSAKYNIPHISTGDIFRKAIAEGTEMGKLAQKYMSKLVPDEIVIKLVEERLSQPDCANGVIFDGFPRTVNQAEEYLKSGKLDKVIYFDIDEEVVVNRILNRRTCKECSEIYSTETYNQPTCAKCGGELIVRSEDSNIRERINTYNAETYPLVEYFKKKDLLFEVNTRNFASSKPEEQIQETYNKITSELDKLL